MLHHLKPPKVNFSKMVIRGLWLFFCLVESFSQMVNSLFKTLRIELIIDKLEIYSIWVSWLKVKRLKWTLRIRIQTFLRLLTLQYQIAMSNFHPDIEPKSGSKWNVYPKIKLVKMTSDWWQSLKVGDKNFDRVCLKIFLMAHSSPCVSGSLRCCWKIPRNAFKQLSMHINAFELWIAFKLWIAKWVIIYE